MIKGSNGKSTAVCCLAMIFSVQLTLSCRDSISERYQAECIVTDNGFTKVDLVKGIPTAYKRFSGDDFWGEKVEFDDSGLSRYYFLIDTIQASFIKVYASYPKSVWFEQGTPLAYNTAKTDLNKGVVNFVSVFAGTTFDSLNILISSDGQKYIPCVLEREDTAFNGYPVVRYKAAYVKGSIVHFYFKIEARDKFDKRTRTYFDTINYSIFK
ncbi:hypothetical protein [Chitinophaga japonensis]|uniref:Uncharacterized protein n=1 Tax=Chitinophaga japonensis TaxID=104662 RepID=A0A562T688_CHIJA|nr:hypothetical protein [Chitinophaga japonensis]TWI89061.1 hypothetical protein LX66_3154 [Chitinophaga japonensis]